MKKKDYLMTGDDVEEGSLGNLIAFILILALMVGGVFFFG